MKLNNSVITLEIKVQEMFGTPRMAKMQHRVKDTSESIQYKSD